MSSNSKTACTTILHYVFPQHNFFETRFCRSHKRSKTCLESGPSFFFLKKKKKGRQNAVVYTVHLTLGGTQELETEAWMTNQPTITNEKQNLSINFKKMLI